MSKKDQATPAPISGVSGPVIELALKNLLVDETKNLRTHAVGKEEIRQLADSIKSTNWVSPVLVTLLPDTHEGEEDYQLVAGFSRVKAVTLLKEEGFDIPSIPAQVIKIEEGDDKARLVFNWAENAVRVPLGLIDSADAISTMMEAGMSKNEIAERTGKSATWIQVVLSLKKLPGELQKLVQEGAVPFKIARHLPSMPEEERGKVLESIKAGKSASEIVNDLTQGRRVKNTGKGKRKKKIAASVEASGPVFISSKAAVVEFESMIAKTKEEAGEKKLTSTQEWTIKLYKNLIDFLHAKKGIKVLHKNIVDVA